MSGWLATLRSSATVLSHARWAAIVVAIAAVAMIMLNRPTSEPTDLIKLAAVQQGDPFSVSPTQATAYTEVSISGSSCTGAMPGVKAFLVGPDGADLPGTFTFGTPDPAGAWSGTFTVPPIAAAGSYQVRASCFPDLNSAQCDNPVAGRVCGQVDYATQPFEVLSGELATVAISPREAAAGVAIPLTVSGTLCRTATPVVHVFVYPPEHSEKNFETWSASGSVIPDAGGSWSVEIALPPLKPAAYTVAASCWFGDQKPFFTYANVGLTVGSAVAAPPRLNFTG